MKKFATKSLFILLVFQLTFLGCNTKSSTGLLIGKIQDNSFILEISTKKIQKGLSNLLSHSGQDFVIKSVEIVKYQNRFFLKVNGHEDQKCMIALKEYYGELFELNDKNTPIIVCKGCENGCEPKLKNGVWYCSDGCSECFKTSSVSENYIFK